MSGSDAGFTAEEVISLIVQTSNEQTAPEGYRDLEKGVPIPADAFVEIFNRPGQFEPVPPFVLERGVLNNTFRRVIVPVRSTDAESASGGSV